MGSVGRLLTVTVRIENTDAKLRPRTMISESALKWLFVGRNALE